MSAPPPAHVLPFAGARAGTEPLTWSQHWIAEMIESLAPANMHTALPITVEVPAGLGLDDVLRAVGALVERHESLRTTIGTDDSGERVQIVTAYGELTVRFSLSEITAALIAQMRHPRFTETELPVRATVVLTGDGKPLRVLLLLSHMAADWWAVNLLTQDLEALLTDPRSVPPPPDYQMLDRARAERTDRFRRRSQASLLYWERQLRRFPPTMFPGPPQPPATPRYQEAFVESPGLAATVQAAAARLGSTVPTVLLAAVAAVLADRSGLDRCGMIIIVANRTDPQARQAVGPSVEFVPLCLEIGASTFPALVRLTYLQTLAAYKHGQYDHARLAETIEAATRGRAGPVDLTCVLNIRDERLHRQSPRATTGEPGLRPAERRSWSGPGFDRENVGLYLDIRALTACVRLSLRADSTILGPSQSFDLLETVEHVVARACDPGLDILPALALPREKQPLR